MKVCLLSTTQMDPNLSLRYWKGSNVDNIFIQIKKNKKPPENINKSGKVDK